ncbi:MAG: YbhB/YbcL family Raf kinase inhibitor-like protein [Planctomycetota bacterium]
MPFELLTEAFQHEQPIPQKYSQDGENVSPPLRWSGMPDATSELALIAEDPDAPTDQPYVHWVIYKIPTTLDHLPEGVAQSPRPDRPTGVYQGQNSAGNAGYDGPAPPKGHGRHRYYFTLYALDRVMNIQPGLTKNQLLEQIKPHILDQCRIIGTYER